MKLRVISSIFLLTVFALPCSMVFSKAVYQKNRHSDMPLFRFEKNGKAGYINTTGKVVIAPQFDVGWFSEEDFVEGLSPARRGEDWGFIDTSGKWIIPAQYWRVAAFSEGLAAVTFQLKGYDFPVAYIEKDGHPVIEFPKGLAEAGPFSEGMAAVRSNGYTSVGKLGYVDRTGTVVVPYQFAVGGPFHNGLAAVVLDGHCYVEARNGGNRSTPPSTPSATSCGGVPASIVTRCGEGFINKKGEVVFRFDGVRDFEGGLAAVEKSGRWGYINPEGKLVVEPKFESARSFSEGVAAVQSAGKWGYLNREGNWVISPQFATADDFSDGVALTSIGYIDKAGRVVASAMNGSAFVQGLAHVTIKDGEYGYADHSGKIIFRYSTQPVRPSMLPYSGR